MIVAPVRFRSSEHSSAQLGTNVVMVANTGSSDAAASRFRFLWRNSTSKLDALLPSILDKAFKGEL